MIDFVGVSKGFSGQEVLRDATLRVSRGERIGIVGPNGAGKSTIFALITGELSPDRGTVTVQSGVRLAHLHQHLDIAAGPTSLLDYAQSGLGELDEIHRRIEAIEHGFHDEQEGNNRQGRLRLLGELQARFEALGGYGLRSRAEISLGGLGFPVEQFPRPISSFSGGWQMRAELARVLVAEPDLLLLDEPTNYLDIPAVEWLQRFLRGFRGTLLLISHDRYLLNALTAATIEVAHARATRYPGNYDAYVEARRMRAGVQLSALRNQQRKREKAERFIERFRAKNTKASQAQSMVKKLERMERIEAPEEIVSPGRIRLPAPARSGQEVVRLERAGFTYDGIHWVLRGVDLSVERGERVALVGLNGTGKSTLLRLLAGEVEPAEGLRRPGHNAQVGYQSQEFAETMDPALTVFDTVKRLGTMSDLEARTILGGFGFSGEAIEKRVAVLSGGERVRLAFARLLANPPNFLVLDEPTTHLDIQAREGLEQALAEFDGTLCIVSHDIEFVRAAATTIVAMAPPGIRRYCGGYDYYCRKLAEEAAAAPSIASEPAVSQRQADRRARAALVQRFAGRRRELRSQLTHIEERISAFETEQTELTAQLSRPGAAGPELAAVGRRLAELQQRLSDYNRRWEAFAVELDEVDREYETERIAIESGQP